mgnify:CR=1 FL=1
MKRGFTILFIELFCVQASLFLGALLQEYALFCQIMLLFFLALTYRRIYLLARRSLKNAQEEAKFQAIQKQEQLQKEQEQLFVSRKQETLEFQQSTIRKLETLQNYLKTNEYDKIQDYLPAITDDFQRERFHPICQDSLINAILAGKDVLGIMPTGAGKSICYQVPALMFPGITVVVSPLISLMIDQVKALNDAGIHAAYINSALTETQITKALYNAMCGRYKIVYVAPERLETDRFLEFVMNADISMITVDEAHCISQWGQDFRPSYLKIVNLIKRFPKRPVVSAFTATATQTVKEDIQCILGLQNPEVLITGFDRKNLYFEVQRPKDKFTALCDILDSHKNQSAIVYCSTRKTVEEVCERLNDNGYDATRYHAGLDDDERQKNQDDFIYDRCEIMVATNAFGMGIDKSNVYLVVHYNMPKNIESYYQEAGRAGRDGGDADCIMLYSARDVNTARYFIENPDENSEISDQMRIKIMEKDFERLKMMTFYCTTSECLRAFILEYFGENPPLNCDNCGNCNTNFETTDITVDAQKIVSCVYRIRKKGRSCGKTLLAEVLYGSNLDKIKRLDLDTISTYGIMSDMSLKRIRYIIDYLIQEGYLEVDEMNYRTVQPTPKTKEILNGKELSMKLIKEVSYTHKKDTVLTSEEDRLFERLKKLRNRRAVMASVPAYVIFQDSTLREMCRKRPVTDSEFLNISGVGEMKKRKYGKEFMEEIQKFINENE